MSKMKTDEEVEKILTTYGYKKDGLYLGANKPIKCIDNDGYIVYPTLSHLYSGKIPLRFHKSNPHTIDNIKHYIIKNHIDVELCSEEFTDAKSKLIFRCSCGNLYDVCLSNFMFNNKHRCNECVFGQADRSPSYDLIIERLAKNKLKPLFTEMEYQGVCSTVGTVQNDCGYKAMFKSWFVEKECEPEWFHRCNPYTIDNINLYLKNSTNNEYVCVSTEYINEHEYLEILHKSCGRTFFAKWINLYRKASDVNPNRNGTRCPHCTGLRYQSLHAVVLKQLFQCLKEGTVLEDKSCINPLTGCILPTDIVNYNEKIVVEIQSWFHDRKEQQIKDVIKKEYWENRGYKVYTPDIRNYSVLGMAQIFFPELKQIPEWVQYNFESKLNVDIAQKLLNEGLLVSEVALEMGVSSHRIYDAIYSKRLVYPDDYKNKTLVKLKHLNQQETVQTAG